MNMKLVLITCIEEFEKEVKKILNLSGVKTFAYQSVKGYKNAADNELNTWFATDAIGTDSLLFTVFAAHECIVDLYAKAEAFNRKQESLSHIHIATIALEKFN